MFLLGHRAVFDEKGGFGGGSQRHRNKSFLQKGYPKEIFLYICREPFGFFGVIKLTFNYEN
tara:strand:+ start:207 stop:389 length:183 start_codon:yes stop_codon:yes gene_type:complete